MRGRVQPAGSEVEADRGGGPLGEPSLLVFRKRAGQDPPFRPEARSTTGVREGNQRPAEFGEQVGEVNRRQCRIVIAQQHVIRLGRRIDRTGRFTAETDHPVQPWPEACVIGFLPGLRPCLLGQRRHPSRLLDQVPRQLGIPVVGRRSSRTLAAGIESESATRSDDSTVANRSPSRGSLLRS